MRKTFLLLFAGIPMLAFAQLKITPDKVSRIDSLLKAQYKPDAPGMVLLVAQEGRPVFEKAYGLANLELNVPLNTDHKFGIGSISKQFTAASILLLQKEGKLSIKDDIRKYLPRYNTHGRTITIEHILSHTSGIPSYTELMDFDTIIKKPLSNQKFVEFFQDRPLLFEPGTNWSYSNSGFVLAALIVEKVSGMGFNEFMKKRIFEPLMMFETTVGSSLQALKNKTAEYTSGPNGPIKLEAVYDWYWAYGAGQIISTARDMLKWDNALNTSHFLGQDDLMNAHKSFILQSGQPAYYGLGWAVSPFSNKQMISHGGAIGGYRSEAIRVPEDRLYCIILSNSGNTVSRMVMNRIISVLYDIDPLKVNRNVMQDPGPIEGVYESLNAGSRLQSNFGTRPVYLEVKKDTNRISVRRTGAAPFFLLPAGKDTLFQENNPYQRWIVVRNDRGEVTGLQTESHTYTSGPNRFNKKVNISLPQYKATAGTPEVLRKFEGTYAHAFGNRQKISLVRDTLTVQPLPEGQPVPLLWIETNRFISRNTSQEYLFQTNKKGEVTGYRYFNGAYELAFRKIEEYY